MTRILLAEDDPNLGQLLQEYLTLKGYQTDLVRDGNEALDRFLQQKSYELCIFDVMMPKKDGFTLAKEVRMANPEIPIIFLTAKAMKEDTLHGFRVGGDDYLTKPFNMEELLARMKAVLRRTQPGTETKVTKQDAYQIGAYTFDPDRQSLTNGVETFKLTGREADLLKLFAQHLNQPLSRSYALKAIWGDDSYFNARSMDVYITKLRKYLRHDPNVQIINLHGEGFKMMA
ncbi:MAG: response regulator transcription factor [Cytophagaceae bacterium]|nr:response regulator transcription factor [Cytophagaceae bacterium]